MFCCNSGYGSVVRLGFGCEMVIGHGKKIAIGSWDSRELETGCACLHGGERIDPRKNAPGHEESARASALVKA